MAFPPKQGSSPTIFQRQRVSRASPARINTAYGKNFVLQEDDEEPPKVPADTPTRLDPQSRNTVVDLTKDEGITGSGPSRASTFSSADRARKATGQQRGLAPE